MTRQEIIRRCFNRNDSVLELGASYSPIAPKSDGWNVTVVDHASQAELVNKYGALGIKDVDRIEPVDFVWQGAALTQLIPAAMHGTFDGLIASHVGEHLPDLIGFLQDAAVLLKPDGRIALALPDKRVCFDFFQPLTMTGDLLAAHTEARVRHQRRTFFNQAAYYVTNKNKDGWAHGENAGPFHLSNSLWEAQRAYDLADDGPASEYSDSHAWTFTPTSFELLILELNLLGHIDWAVQAIGPAAGVEFYVWLERKRVTIPDIEVNRLRLSLLMATFHETQDAIGRLGVASSNTLENYRSTIADARTQPSIAVIIPLFNGSRYIEKAITSVFRQTLLPTEVVIVSDGSTDASVEIVNRLANVYPIKLLHTPNGGQSAARNIGVRESQSDLIAFLDQDDIWYKTHLEELAKPFLTPSEPSIGWVYSDVDEIDRDDCLVCRSFLSTMPAVHPKKQLAECIRQNMFILPSASLISREAFNAGGGFDERLSGYEDDDLFLRIFRKGYDNVFVAKALSQWRIYTTSSSYTPRFAKSRYIYCQKLIDMFPNDKKLGRYYIRDLIVPRFLDEALRDYENAIVEGDQEESAWEQVMLLARHCEGTSPKFFEHSIVISHYARALLIGDPARIQAARHDVMILAGEDDLLVRHFLERALKHYKLALSNGEDAAIVVMWKEVFELLSHVRSVPGRVRRTLSILRYPAISKLAFTFRRIGRPAMLWAFRMRPLATGPYRY